MKNLIMKYNKVLSLITGLFCFINSFSQNYAGVTSIGSVTACPNTVINVPLYLTHSPMIGSITLTINYNPAVISAIQNGNNPMSLININPNLSTFDGVQSNNPFNGAKQVRFGWYSGANAIYPDTNLSGVAKICDMQFRYFGGTTLVTFDNSTNNGHYSIYSGSNGPLIDTPTVNYYISGMVTQDSVPVIQGNITGNLSPCVGSNSQYSVASSSGISYTWTGPGTWVGSSDSSSISYLIGTFSTDSIIVAPINACGDTGNTVSFVVNQNLPPGISGNISGNIHPSVGSYSQYSVVDSAGLGYYWLAPGTWTGTSTTSSITFLVGSFTTDTIFVRPINVCGDTGNAVFLIVTDSSLGISKIYKENLFSVTNYPNPFSKKTTIDFNLPEPGIVTIDIFNIFGEHLLNIPDNYFTQGRHDVPLNMSNFVDGIYSYKVKYNLKGKVLSKTCLMNIIK
jgi:PKD-like domain/Secretion system C-terminal sorting domain